MRSAYELDSPRDEAPEMKCAANPDAWAAQAIPKREYAMHVCLEHCPALAWCRRETPERELRIGMVIAGVSYNVHGVESSRMQPARSCGLCPGGCPARIHNSLRALQDHGCHCPEAVEKQRAHWRRYQARRKQRVG